MSVTRSFPTMLLLAFALCWPLIPLGADEPPAQSEPAETVAAPSPAENLGQQLVSRDKTIDVLEGEIENLKAQIKALKSQMRIMDGQLEQKDKLLKFEKSVSKFQEQQIEKLREVVRDQRTQLKSLNSMLDK